MVKTLSTMLQLGTLAPSFSLKDTKGLAVSINDFKEVPGILIIFMCNHCPYVHHIQDVLVKLAQEWQARELVVIGINSNDIISQPDDSPEKMKEYVAKIGYTFPYLFDETQEVAKAYRAACTPDFFLFNDEFKLVYRGQFDDSRPGNSILVSGKDLQKAVEALLTGQSIAPEQLPSMGCNIKWKPGNSPDYFC